MIVFYAIKNCEIKLNAEIFPINYFPTGFHVAPLYPLILTIVDRCSVRFDNFRGNYCTTRWSGEGNLLNLLSNYSKWGNDKISPDNSFPTSTKLLLITILMREKFLINWWKTVIVSCENTFVTPKKDKRKFLTLLINEFWSHETRTRSLRSRHHRRIHQGFSVWN